MNGWRGGRAAVRPQPPLASDINLNDTHRLRFRSRLASRLAKEHPHAPPRRADRRDRGRATVEPIPRLRERRPMTPTPPSLLEKLRSPDDAEAWARFVRLYTPLLWRWLTRRGATPADAADVTQDVFVVLLQKLPEFT